MWKRTQRTIKARSVENRVFQIEQNDYTYELAETIMAYTKLNTSSNLPKSHH